MTHTVTALTADRLTCNRGGRIVFADLSFRAEAGVALMVTGPNGAGKSSLLRLIAGVMAPAAGHLRLEGGSAELSLGQQCHYFGHQDALKTALTMRENLSFWRAFNGPDGLDVEAALEAVALDHIGHLLGGWLSAGQRRRLSLARLLVSRRPIWLMDEPSSALDAASEARLCGLIDAHLAAGGLAVIATHAPLTVDRQASLVIGADAAVAA